MITTVLAAVKGAWDNLALVAILALIALLYFANTKATSLEKDLSSHKTALEQTNSALDAERELTDRLLDQAKFDQEQIAAYIQQKTKLDRQMAEFLTNLQSLGQTDEATQVFLSTPTGDALQRLLDLDDQASRTDSAE